MENTITSRDNRLIKYIKSLQLKKVRDQEKRFFVEGIKMLDEAVKQKAEIYKIVACYDILQRIHGGPEFINMLAHNGIAHETVPEQIFKDISDTDSPQGILAVIEKRHRIEENIEYGKDEVYVLLDGVQDPGNVGTIIRTADAAGIDGVILSKGCADVYNPKTLRSTMGSIFRMPVYERADICKTAQRMKDAGIKVLVASLKSAKLHYEIDYSGGTALVIGNEANGVSEEIEKMADLTVKIPMRGGAESLNASVAAGILMYEIMRHKCSDES